MPHWAIPRVVGWGWLKLQLCLPFWEGPLLRLLYLRLRVVVSLLYFLIVLLTVTEPPGFLSHHRSPTVLDLVHYADMFLALGQCLYTCVELIEGIFASLSDGVFIFFIFLAYSIHDLSVEQILLFVALFLELQRVISLSSL